jgi:hypothetical protein
MIKLIDFIECFEPTYKDINVELYLDPYLSTKLFIENGSKYDLEYTGSIMNIPITYGNTYVNKYETYIDWDRKVLEIYVRDRIED